MPSRLKKAALREPSPVEKQAMAEAEERTLRRPQRVTVETKFDPKTRMATTSPPHSDTLGSAFQLGDAFGTNVMDVVMTALGQLGNVCGADQKDLNAALAMIGAVGPKDEFEAALAVQIATNHAFSMNLLGRAARADNAAAREANVNMATKVSRTMLASVETLAKLRGGGKQVVEHRYINVQGNAVVGDVHTGGGGADLRNPGQTHAQALAYEPGPPGAPMWSEDQERGPVPLARGERAEPLSDAWRDEPGRAEGKGERELSERPAHGGDAADPPASSRAHRKCTPGRR